ncbi:DUF4832 domain-containing protein [Candidatus Woesebacteria bacterium]|nr:DUF4832 domain-containing protein [Candidatus Woesebacteria bacterium]
MSIYFKIVFVILVLLFFPFLIFKSTYTQSTLSYTISLSASQEVSPNSSTGTGNGTITLDTNSNILTFNISYTGLSSVETAAHIHGPAPYGVSAGILFTLPSGSQKTGTWNYPETLEQAILTGQTYVNIHSQNYSDGEIRGQIILPGDANSDAQVNTEDLMAVLINYPTLLTDAVDQYRDGKINTLDYAVVLKFLVPTAGPSPTPTPGSTKTFSPTDEDFANPERGFMKQSTVWVDQPLDPTKIKALQPSDTVVWIYFRLDNYRDPRDGVGVKPCPYFNNCTFDYAGKALEPLGSGIGLDTVKAAFNTARSKGFKLVLRFIYNTGTFYSPDPLQVEPDMPIDWALAHINQLKPLILENSDVIVGIQTGFVGHWGEWHSPKYLGSLDNRKAITDALLATLPKNRILMMRAPAFKQRFYGGPVSDSIAYNESDVARVGLHDDSFLKNDTDDETFKSNQSGMKASSYCDNYPPGEIQCWRDFVHEDTRFTPVSGEASVPNSPRSDCPNALTQLASMHWSVINNGFNLTLLNSWISQGCMPEVRRRLGYRYELSTATYPTSITRGGTFHIEFNLINRGFASMFNPRPVFLVLYNTGSKYTFQFGVDPRRWQPNIAAAVNQDIILPSNMTTGSYKLALWLPDEASSLRNNPLYAVRFANLDVWEITSGYNIIDSNISVN